jgi:hypothetical protein
MIQPSTKEAADKAEEDERNAFVLHGYRTSAMRQQRVLERDDAADEPTAPPASQPHLKTQPFTLNPVKCSVSPRAGSNGRGGPASSLTCREASQWARRGPRVTSRVACSGAERRMGPCARCRERTTCDDTVIDSTPVPQ